MYAFIQKQQSCGFLFPLFEQPEEYLISHLHSSNSNLEDQRDWIAAGWSDTTGETPSSCHIAINHSKDQERNWINGIETTDAASFRVPPVHMLNPVNACQTFVIDERYAREPSDRVRLSKTASRIQLMRHPDENDSSISFMEILRGPYPLGSISENASMK